MKATELRIGNYYYGDVLFPSEYNVITANDLVELDSDPLDDYYQPLPLTEEWLIKFGFEKKIDCYKNINYNFNGYFASFDCDNPMWFGEDGCCEQVTIKDNIKYVHQLQNLYFAVTNEELTMK